MLKKSVKKVVLAYSGGLDTSIILKWLQTTYACEVVTFTADLGQGEELGPARDKALLLGIKPENIFIEDLREEFGVVYHQGHVARILKTFGWTPQLPIVRAIQRDEVAIARWANADWPTLKARAENEGRTLVFLDESGSYLLLSRVRTYGLKGRTPGAPEWQTHDDLSVMGGLTPNC